MKKSLVAILAFTVLSIGAYAQEGGQKDPKAKTILDKASAKTKSYSTIYIEFSYRIVNKVNGIDETQDGKIWIKGDYYKLEFPGIVRYCDGASIWTVLEDDEECQINAVDPDDESYLNPSTLLTIYESGFNYQYGEETTINGAKVDMIKLYPEGGTKTYHTIKLYVNKATSQIARIEILGKDGNTMFYDLTVFKNNQPMEGSMFVFDTNNTDFDIIDLRD